VQVVVQLARVVALRVQVVAQLARVVVLRHSNCKTAHRRGWAGRIERTWLVA
jgi:hypothetical protein